MPAFERNIFVAPGTPSATVAIDFGNPQSFIAWGAITWLDPHTGAFDANNAVGFDIPFIIGFDNNLVPTSRVFSGGALGSPGAFTNLRKSSQGGFGRGAIFRLRAFPNVIPGEFACVANCVVISSP